MSQIKSIQVLRAVAALAVVFGHLEHEATTIASAASSGFAPILLDLTGAGVDLFFVISGFVMVFASRNLFGQPGAARSFLVRRVARIVPLYWIMTTLFLVTLFLGSKVLSSVVPSADEILKSYLFVPYAAGDAVQPVYKLGWTLNYEMFFYVVFAALLFLPRRSALGMVAALFALLATAGAWFSPQPGPIAFWTHPIVLEFVMGAAVASAHLDGVRITRPSSLLLLAAGMLGFAAAVLSGLDAHGPLRPLLWGLPAATILAASTLRGAAAARPQAAGLLVLLGDASYALYLLHPMVIRVLRMIWDRAPMTATLNPWVYILVCLGAVLPVAVMVHFWIERPTTRYLSRLLSAPRAPQAMAPSFRG